MEEKLRIIINEYIESVNGVCINLLKGLNLKSKEGFWKYKETHWGTEFEGKEIYSIPYDDIGYPKNAVRIMSDILINVSKETR